MLKRGIHIEQVWLVSYCVILVKDWIDALRPGQDLTVKVKVILRKQVYIQQILHAVVRLLQTQ